MLVTFNNVSLQYVDKNILKNVSFTINDNAKIGIVGMNGAGKSTILKLIVGELTPSSGIIYKKNDLNCLLFLLIRKEDKEPFPRPT